MLKADRNPTILKRQQTNQGLLRSNGFDREWAFFCRKQKTNISICKKKRRKILFFVFEFVVVVVVAVFVVAAAAAAVSGVGVVVFVIVLKVYIKNERREWV